MIEVILSRDARLFYMMTEFYDVSEDLVKIGQCREFILYQQRVPIPVQKCGTIVTCPVQC
jgi:hypothetical protein